MTRISGGWEIWLINADGSGLRQLIHTNGADAFYPVWSPDGARLGYTTRAGKAFVIEVATPWQSQTPQPVRMSIRPEVSFGVRHWSSDANKFTIYLRTLNGGPPGIGFYSIAPERVEQLSNGGDFPLWLNDNRRLIYMNRGSLWLVDTETKKSRTLLSVQPNNIHTFSLSRDNRRLCYTLRTSESDIWILSQK